MRVSGAYKNARLEETLHRSEEPAGDVRPTLRGNRFPHADVKK